MFSVIRRIISLLDAQAKRSIFYIGILTIAMVVGNAAVPFLFRSIVHQFELPHSMQHIVIYLVLAYGALWMLNKLIVSLQCMVIAKFTERSIRAITKQLFIHLHTLSLRFHASRKTGALVSTIGRVQNALEAILYGSCFCIIPTILNFVCTCLVFTYFYGLAYSFLFFLVTVCSLAFSFAVLARLKQRQKEYYKAQDSVRQKCLDSLLNYETVKYFSNEQQEYYQFDALLAQQERAGKNRYIIEYFFDVGQSVLFGLCLLYITWNSAYQVLDGTIEMSDFVLINSYLLRFIVPLNYLGRAIQRVKKSVVALEEINHILNEVPEVIDAPGALELSNEPVAIRFHNICFGYQKECPILSNLTFSVEPGKHIALVGATGSGKSTITKLLLRLYDVESGSITLNKHDIRSIAQTSLRNTIGVVSQEIHLFNDTLYNNLTYGCSTASLQEVEQIIKCVQLDRLIKQLLDGYQTVIGERGLKLSGGEKQRLSIARALLKDAAVYIFDESTSNLDTTTELIIQRNLKSFFASKTTITIAHRLSQVTNADEILVLNKGTIVERGAHKQLMMLRGSYHELWSNQHGHTHAP